MKPVDELQDLADLLNRADGSELALAFATVTALYQHALAEAERWTTAKLEAEERVQNARRDFAEAQREAKTWLAATERTLELMKLAAHRRAVLLDARRAA